MKLFSQIRSAASVSLVLGALFGLGDLARVFARHTEYLWDPAMIALWVAKAAALGMAFALILTAPLAIVFLAGWPGDGSPERARRVGAGAWILVHVFLVLLWQDYKSLEQEFTLARMAAKGAFVLIAALGAWGLSGLAARAAGTLLRAIRPRVIALLAVAAVAAWLGARWTAERAAGPDKQASGPNVLFILVDTLRADSLSCYGYDRPTSPRIDALAGEGALFKNVIADSSWTIPTVASIFTGVYPEVHRVTNYQAVLSEQFVTLAEAFRAAGYRTGARISNILISGHHGYHQGFDDARIVMNLHKLLFLDKLLAQARITSQYYFARGDEIGDAGLDWLRRHKDERFFFYLHYYDPHFPYYPPAGHAMRYVEPEMAERYPYRAFVADTIWNMVSEYKLGQRRRPEELAYIKAVYDAEINYADDQVARVLDYLDEAGLTDDTIIVFTADHGEQFYEHGQKLHSKTLYNEEIHVPLIIKAPGYAPRVIAERVRGLDIYRTLIALADLPARLPADGIAGEIEAQAMGASLVPLMKGGTLPPGFDGAAYSSLDMDTVIKEAYFEGEWKLIRNIARGDDLERPPVELYRLPRDPGEQDNLAGREAEVIARLADRAAKGRASMAERAVVGLDEKPLSKSEVEKLKALGYINQ